MAKKKRPEPENIRPNIKPDDVITLVGQYLDTLQNGSGDPFKIRFVDDRTLALKVGEQRFVIHITDFQNFS